MMEEKNQYVLRHLEVLKRLYPSMDETEALSAARSIVLGVPSERRDAPVNAIYRSERIIENTGGFKGRER